MSADQGHTPSQVSYGICLEFTTGGERSITEAVRYYKMAVDGGQKPAVEQYERCMRIEQGEGSSELVDLSKFESVRELGSGGFGVVKLMRHKETSELIAVKFFNPGMELTWDENFLEVAVLCSLHHARVLRVIGWSFPNEEGMEAQIATEYMSNGSLEDVLSLARKKEEPNWWTHENISILIIDIVDGLRYIHSQNVIHRDMKPANILIDSEYRARIADFGLSRFEGKSQSMRPMGTMRYMAPETLEGKIATKKVDVFAFGLILYEILVGESVIPRDASDLRIVTMHVEGIRPAIPEWIDDIVRMTIEACLSPDPEKRPMFEDIYGLLEGTEFPFYEDVSGEVIRRRLGDDSAV
jgi:serine/threonine protein kinase